VPNPPATTPTSPELTTATAGAAPAAPREAAVGAGSLARSAIPVPPRQRFPLRLNIKRVLWAVAWRTIFRTCPRPIHFWRNWVLRAFGAKLHPTARVCPTARIWAPWNLVMHEHAAIGEHTDIYSVDTITLGACSTVSQYSYLCTASHDFEDPDHPLITAPITIGAKAWVAADVYVGPGVTIGQGTVVGARSSVYKDLPPWVLAVGNPARPVRPRVFKRPPGGPGGATAII